MLLDEELRRVIPVIEAIVSRSDVLISVDTSKADVARQALTAGAQIVNDVTSLREDPAMVELACSGNAGFIVMHMQGTPKTMQLAPSYQNVVEEVATFLSERLDWLEAQGIARERIVVDPGIGFGKTTEHNLRIIARLDRIAELGRPVCLGHSRKGFIGKVLGRREDQREYGTAGVALVGYLHGASLLRVHDVAAIRDVISIARAIGSWEAEIDKRSGEGPMYGSSCSTA